jgi:hypothetical protein
MKNLIRLLLILAALGTVSPRVFGQVPPAEVHVKLLLADNKTTYRMGEPIKLILEFTADREGYTADTIPDGWQLTSDVISLSPQRGATPWLDEYFGGHRYSRDVFAPRDLSQTPTRVELFINSSLRFDKPGKYTVQVTTHRVSSRSSSNEIRPTIVLTTNSVNFNIEPMSEADEAKEVKRLSDLLDATRAWQAEEKITQELSFLTGDVSTREKVKRFLNSEGRSGNYGKHINFGLFIARNRPLVLQLLETAMRDPNTPVTYALLSATTSLRMLREQNGPNVRVPTHGQLSPTEDPRLLQIKQTYLAELAAGLNRRTGKSQTSTAMTILMHLPKDTQPEEPILAEVRRLLIQQFDSLHPFDQEYLLRVYWEKLGDPSLVPSLEKMLAYTGQSNKNIHDEALKRLMEISPEKAKQYVIAEIRDPKSLVDYQVLQSLPDESLAEVDMALVEQLRTLASSKVNFDRVHLKHKAFLAARYASKNVYPDLMELYTRVGTKLTLEVRAGLLAYLVKQNEAEALPLIEQTLDEVKPGEDFNFLPQLTRLYFSEAIDVVLRKRLESGEPEAASNAAYLISLHGPAGDQKVLEARLERWQKEWAHRPAEADANGQGPLERELILALVRAKSWKLSPERVKALQQACITKVCRRNFRIQ